MSARVQIIKMAQAGTTPANIAAAMNCKVQRVYDVLKAARGQGMDIPKFARGPSLPPTTLVQVSRITAQRLKPDAERRNMTVEQLICAMTTAIAADGLVGAVLDGGRHD